MSYDQPVEEENKTMIIINKAWYRINKSIFLTLLFSALFINCNRQDDTQTVEEKPQIASVEGKILAESISLQAELLPEFKTDPHAKETQGNQISGVVRTIFQDKTGKFWFGTQNGLCRYDGTSLIYYDIKNDFGKGITIKAIAEDNIGNLWFGHTDGITKYDGEYFTSYSEKDGLISNDVWSITTDSRGMVWIGTIDGVNRFDGKNFTPFEIPEAEPDHIRGVTSAKIVHCIIEDSKGNMWFATNGGAYMFDGKLLSNISEEDGLCSKNVNCIIEDSKGNFWFATANNGLCRFDGSSFINLTENWFVEGTGLESIIEDKYGNIWFAVKGFGVYKYDGKIFTNFHTKQGLFSHATFQIYEDRQERLWFVGFMGAFRYDSKSFVNVTRNGPW